jgi:sulfatase modifying factor 1
MYCAGQGEELCGAVGGGAGDYHQDKDAFEDEWFSACSAGGALTYPYGNTYEPKACNGTDYGASGLLPGGFLSTCASAAQGPFDMSGNVWEWENACDPTTGSGATEVCRRRGGSFYSTSPDLTCAIGGNDTRQTASISIGFRCCQN